MLPAGLPTTERTLIVDWKLELVAVPVSDVDRAKSFYADQVGFNVDHDHTVSDEIRFVQLTPPGSACSIALGKGIVDAPPGSVAGLQLVVSDVHEARSQLVERGIEASDVQEFPWGSFVFFADPDGNRWSVQQFPLAKGARADRGGCAARLGCSSARVQRDGSRRDRRGLLAAGPSTALRVRKSGPCQPPRKASLHLAGWSSSHRPSPGARRSPHGRQRILFRHKPGSRGP